MDKPVRVSGGKRVEVAVTPGKLVRLAVAPLTADTSW